MKETNGKYLEHTPRALINLFSNELVDRRHDQNNIPESFFPTDITLNKMPRAWSSLKSTYRAISSPKYFKDLVVLIIHFWL